MSVYVVRQSLLTPAVTWRLTAGELIEGRIGKAERRWPLAGVRRIRLAPAGNRYVPDATIARLAFGKGAVTIGSHSAAGVGRYADQGRAFAGFIRELCAETARTAPHARFEAGAPRAPGVFIGAMAILAVGVVAVLLAALSAGAPALGLDLSARLSFPLLLMIAAQPWLSGAGPIKFDPFQVPSQALAGGRP